MRVHRSFIVALDRVERVRARRILIETREIPVGDTYTAVLKSRFG
jgi:DNA-binding LytR/AlgR family response regulator